MNHIYSVLLSFFLFFFYMSHKCPRIFWCFVYIFCRLQQISSRSVKSRITDMCLKLGHNLYYLKKEPLALWKVLKYWNPFAERKLIFLCALWWSEKIVGHQIFLLWEMEHSPRTDSVFNARNRKLSRL